MAQSYDLKIRNKAVPTPAEGGIVVTDEPVWDPDAGRNLKGKMIATLVCWKRTVEITWNDLTAEDASSILDAINVGSSATPFFDLEYNDIDAGTRTVGTNGRITIHVYTSSAPRTLRTLQHLRTGAADTKRRIGEIKLTFIEQ